MAAWAEKLGFVREDQIRLRVRTAWGMRRSHSWEGKLGSQEASPAQKVIIECADRTFSGIAAVGIWGGKLEIDIVFAEGFLYCTGAFVVEDLESGGCTVLLDMFVAHLPGFGDIQDLPFLQKLEVDGVDVVVLQDEYILVPAGRDYREAACLVRV